MSERPVLADAPDESGRLPETFGKYTLLKRLATGGMAEIFLASTRNGGFEKRLVIKRLRPELAGEPQFAELLRHEAQLAGTLSHPNLVTVFEAGAIDGRDFIAMEHVHGKDVRAIVRQMKVKDRLEFPLEHAVAIALGTLAALVHAHEADLGIVHRDVSPQNVVVTFAGDVKLLDFGVATSKVRIDDDRTTLKGKVAYMSPEQCRGEPLDARSDLFAVGTLLFELTTGKRLFKGESDMETLRLICDREYPRPSDVKAGYPPALERIVMRALAPERSARYASGRDFLADLETFVREEKVGVSRLALEAFMRGLFSDSLSPRDRPSLTSASRVARKRPSALVLTLAAAIAIAAAVVALVRS